MESSYDPTKSYSWEPNTKFIISGRELNLLINLTRGILSTQEASNIILAYEANKSIENMLDNYIKMGVVKEAQPPTIDTNDVEVNNHEEITPETII